MVGRVEYHNREDDAARDAAKVGLAAQLHGASRLAFKPYVHYVTTCNSKKCR